MRANVILGRPGIAQLGAVISMPHLCMKFRTPGGIAVLRGDSQSARKCYARAVAKQEAGTSSVNTILRQEKGRDKPEPVDEVELVPLDPEVPDRTVRVGRTIEAELRSQVISVLRSYADIFA